MKVVSELNEWLNAFFKVSVGSLLVIICKKVYNYSITVYGKGKVADQRRDADIQLLKNAIMAQQHDTIYRLTDEYLHRGYITLDELDNLEYIFNSYRALGGNGSGEYRFNKCKELPLKAGSDSVLDQLIKDHKGGV